MSELPSLDVWREAFGMFERLVALDGPSRERELALLELQRPDLAGHVKTLLNAGPQTQAQALLNAEAIGSAGMAGVSFGDYRLESLVGSGGMGEVWLASRNDGLFQGHAAVKLLHPYLSSSRVRERFSREGQILGRLSHPHIARLLDAGIGAGGALYLVLEHVEGQRIDLWCDHRQLGVRGRVELLLQVCEAVAYAHTHLIVHRDLKPSNILVNAQGESKLLDFGIAKLLAQEDADAELTRLGGLAMTPEYAAPEQLAGEPVSTASDVYALGLLLYTLLCGRHPFRDFLSHPQKLLTAMRTGAPPMMSQSLEPTTAMLRAAGLAPLARSLRGDLDNIAAKALRSEPAQRYASAQALADDLQRYLRHEPVLAQPESWLYRTRKFVRRHWVGVSAAVAVTASLAAGMAGVWWQARIARLEAAKATAVKDFLIGIFEQNSALNPEGERARQVTAEQLLDLGAERIRTGLREAPEVRLELLGTIASLYQSVLVNDRSLKLREEALATARSLHSNERHPQVLEARIALAMALSDNDHLQQARTQLEEVLADLDAAGDHHSMLRVRALSQLAYLCYMLDSADHPRGRSVAKQALELLRAEHPNEPEQGLVLQTLARIEEHTGDLQAADDWYRQAVAFAAGAHNVLMTADIHEDYGDLLRTREQYPEAERELRTALELFRKAAGPDSPLAASSETVMAGFLNDAGRPREALALMQHAVDVLERSLGPATGRTSDALLELGNAQMARGRLLEAAASFARAAQAREQSPDGRNNRAVVLVRQIVPLTLFGQWDAARAALEDCRAIILDIYGEGTPSHGVITMREGELYLAQGEDARARQVFTDVLQRWPPEAGRLPPVYVKPQLGLAELDLRAGNAKGAQARLMPLLDALARHPRRAALADAEAQARFLLGWSLLIEGRAQEALPTLRRSLEQRRSLDDPESLWMTRPRLVLAATLATLGRPQEARVEYEAADAVLDRYPGLAPGFEQLRQQVAAQLR